jgi:DNA-binding NarL/FixJ family response regulator
MNKPRVLIADDHILILEGIRKLLESKVDFVGMAQNGRELISSACRLNPDIILLDISMPGLNGIEAARQLKKRLPNAKLIFLTMHDDAGYIADAFRLGVDGYVLKSSAVSELMEAIQKVAMGQKYVTPLVKIPSNLFQRRKLTGDITVRQREVLQLLAEGLIPKEISSQLRISVRTVEFHKYAIMKKLGLHTLAELILYAVRHEILRK